MVSPSFLEYRLVKWTFVLSCSAMSAALPMSPVMSVLSALFIFFVFYVQTFRYKLLENVFADFNRTILLVAVISAPFAIIGIETSFLEHFPEVLYRIQDKIGVPEYLQTVFAYGGLYAAYCTTLPLLTVFLYGFWIKVVPFVKGIVKTSDKQERLYFITTCIIALIAVAVIYNQTNCFYAPQSGDEIISGDVVFTTDTGGYSSSHAYLSVISNDNKQPLFGVFSMPFAAAAFALSKTFFFVPQGYYVILGIIQIGLLVFSVILLSRMLHLTGWTKLLFFLLYTVLYPTLLFSFNMEQYILSLFWLTVFLYAVFMNKPNQDAALLAASGTVLTNGVLFPLLLFHSKADFAAPYLALRKLVRFGFIFAVFLALFSLLWLYDIRFMTERYEHILQTSGYGAGVGEKVSFDNKLLQYVNFVALCFVKPATVIGISSLETIVNKGISYQLAPVTSLNLLGVILLAVAVLGFVLNWKEPFARICGFWALFSFFVLCLVGWGTAENGLILYSLYFGWAHFCLVFLAIEKVLQKLPLVKYGVYAAATITLTAINLPGIWDVIQFGIQYYPVK